MAGVYGFDAPEETVSLGTTIMAVAYAGGVVLGADSRTSTGSYVANRVADKISMLADNVYICRSGSAADTQAITSFVRLYIEQHSTERGTPGVCDVRTAAQLVQQVAYSNKSALSAGMIVAGWTAAEGGVVYGIPLGGTLLQVPFTLGGSGSSYIYGWVDHSYRPGMTRAECEAFVTRAVSLAMARDGSSGGVIRLVTIHEHGVERKMIEGNDVPLHHDELQGAPLRAR